MLLDKFKKAKLINPPKFLIPNCVYLVYMGSRAYGYATPESDYDVYGVCIPPKDDVFPHLRGEIVGFGRQQKRFEQWQETHKIIDDKEYDFSIVNIVKFFQLAMEASPNILDSLFVPTHSISHITSVGQRIRDNRSVFLSKKVFHTMRGYAFSQISKITTKEPTGKRLKLVKEYGYDVKFAAHSIRLLNECEQLLTEGDMILDRDKEQLKSIRNGEWSIEEIREWFANKEKDLQDLYNKNDTLPYAPDEERIKELLLSCLEDHYGSLDAVISIPKADEFILTKIKEIIDERFR